MFGGWYIFGAPNSNNTKGRAYFYKIFLGAWDYRQTIQASDGSDGDFFGRSISINEKIMVIGQPVGIMAKQCMNLHCRVKHGRRRQN